MGKLHLIFIFIICINLQPCLVDTPADCRLSQAVGIWKFKFTKRSVDNICGVDLSEMPNETTSMKDMKHISDKEVLLEIDIELTHDREVRGQALDQLRQHIGEFWVPEGSPSWDMLYNQGFGIFWDDFQLFGFFQFSPMAKAQEYTSYCYKTYKGWYQIGNSPKIGCFIAEKINGERTPVTKKVDNSRYNKKDLGYLADMFNSNIVSRKFLEFETIKNVDNIDYTLSNRKRRK